MDFVHDQLANGRKFRILTVVDTWHRQCVALRVDFSLTGQSVANVLNEVSADRALTFATNVDYGTESTSKAIDECCYLRSVKLDFVRPGKSTEDGLIESINGQLCDECLNVNEFATLDHVQEILRAWRHDYNRCRLYGSFGNLALTDYLRKWSEKKCGDQRLYC